MLTKHKRLPENIRGFRIIYIIPKYSDVSEILVNLVNLTNLTKQTNLIKQIRIILEETLAAASIFAIAFACLLVARGLGWH